MTHQHSYNSYIETKIYNFLSVVFSKRRVFKKRLDKLVKEAPYLKLVFFYYFLQVNEKGSFRPISIKRYISSSKDDSIFKDKRKFEDFVSKYILSNLILYYVYFKSRKEQRGHVPENLKNVLFAIYERFINNKSFRKNGILPKSTLHYWCNKEFSVLLLQYLSNYLAKIMVWILKEYNVVVYLFIDSTLTVNGENGNKGLKYCVIAAYLNKKHIEIFRLNNELPTYILPLFVIPNYSLEDVGKRIEMLKDLDVKGIFADGEFCHKYVCRSAYKITNIVQIKPHKLRNDRWSRRAKKDFSPEIYKARMPGESVFGTFENAKHFQY